MIKSKVCNNVRSAWFTRKTGEKVRSHIARPKRATRTHIARTVSKAFPHALPHAHRTCGSAILRTCAPQPNIWVSMVSCMMKWCLFENFIVLFSDVGLRRTCAYYRTSARAMCVRKCVRQGFWNCVCDVRACGSFLVVRCAIALLHTFWNKTTTIFIHLIDLVIFKSFYF